MGKKKKLFNADVNTLKVGVTSGHHVVHIIGERDAHDGGVEISEALLNSNGQNRPEGAEITQAEVFSNESDLKTGKKFLELAKFIAAEYNKPYVDDGLANIYVLVKDYLTSSTHTSQQNAISRINAAMTEYENKLDVLAKNKNISVDMSLAVTARSLACLDIKTGIGVLDGNLMVPDDYESPNPDQIKEPKGNNFLDKPGIWQKSTKKLFPHEPSPNDVKQGVGIMDCFMLSSLIQIAEKDPDLIKNRMKDNGNGTVTVQFNDKDNGNKPVFVTVNKTVNQSVFGHNYYAASSLWVQMLEKAYVEYNNKVNARSSGHTLADSKSGFASINRARSDDFLNAFLPQKYTSSDLRIPYSQTMQDNYFSNKRDEYLPKKYLPEEVALAEFFQKQIKDGEIITVGVNSFKANKTNFDYKGHGIRPGHAYTFRNVVKRTVNGEEKYFVQLRDPYASFKTGYDKNGKLIDKSQAVKGFLNAGCDNMGTFELELRDFSMMFSNFCGISNKCLEELNEIPFRQYGLKPLDEEEIANGVNENKERKFSTGVIPEKEENKEPYIVQVEELVNDPSTVAWKDVQLDVISEKISDKAYFEKLQQNLKSAYTDLKSTDQWFVWTNTEGFNALRDSLGELNTMMQKVAKSQEGKDFNLNKDAKRTLAEKIAEVNALSKDYLEAKNVQIANNFADNKKVSSRAVVRVMAASNIEAITDMSEPCSELIGMDQKKLEVITSDTLERIKMYNEGKKIPHDDISLDKNIKGTEAEKKALQLIKDEKLKKNFLNTTNNLEEYLKKNDSSKNPKAKKIVETVENFNKNSDKKPEDDFEIIDENPQNVKESNDFVIM